MGLICFPVFVKAEQLYLVFVLYSVEYMSEGICKSLHSIFIYSFSAL